MESGFSESTKKTFDFFVSSVLPAILIPLRFQKLFFVTDFRFMNTTALFRFLVFSSAVPVFLAVAFSGENDPVSGPPAPEFPPVEESTEIPDLSGVEDSIQIDELEAPGSANAPASDSPAMELPTGKNPDSLKPATVPETPESVPSLETTESLPPLDGLEAAPAASSDPFLEAPKPKEKPAAPVAGSKPDKELKRLESGEETRSGVKKSGDSKEEEISIPRRLLLKLSPPDSVLDGVEQVDLRTFLNAPALRDDVTRTQEALLYYWKAAELRSEVFYWANRLDSMNRLAENALATDREVYRSAAAAAQASLNLAKVSLRSNAMKLASLAGYTREVTAKTLPHAGEYDTRYEEIAKTTPDYSRITYYHGLVTFHQEQLTAAASAYLTEESLLNQVTRNGSAATVLASWDVLNDRRKAFFEVLLDFNDDILNYVLTISTRRGPELAPLLVKPVSAPSNAGASASPSLPTPPEKAPSPPADLPSVMLNPEQAAALPKAQTPIQTQDPETGEIYSENDTIDVSSGGASNQASSAEVQPIESAPVVPVAPVPGYDLGTPPVETAPPGSDFIPIGGETGVDTNPTLNSPTWNDGARLLPRVRPDEKPVTLAKPSILEDAVNSDRGNDFSLTYVLERSAVSDREKAVHAYWQYVMLQEQIFVLERQKNLLGFISRRLLDGLAGKSGVAPLPSDLGTILELHMLTLRASILEMKVEEWKVLNRLARMVSWKVEWPLNFPEAVTDLKTKGFMVGLDQNVSGSAMDRRALPWARHLYFAREELSDSFKCVDSLGDLIAPQVSGLDESELGKRLKNASGEEVKAILESMTEARNVSWKYFQLLYDVNAAYTSCVLSGAQGMKEPDELATLLAN